MEVVLLLILTLYTQFSCSRYFHQKLQVFFSPFNTHFRNNKVSTCSLYKGEEGYKGEIRKSNEEGSWLQLLWSYLCSQFCFCSPVSPGGSTPHPSQMAIPAVALLQCCCAGNCRKSSHKSPMPCLPMRKQAAAFSWRPPGAPQKPYGDGPRELLHTPAFLPSTCLLPLHTKSSSKFLLITVILKCLVSFKFWVISWMQRVAARFLSFQKASFSEEHYIKIPPYESLLCNTALLVKILHEPVSSSLP